MTISFWTEYDQKTMTAVARALRKTVRGARSRRSHRVGWPLAVVGLGLAAWRATGGQWLRCGITMLAEAALIAALLGEDAINGYFACRRLLPGAERATATFNETEFTSDTEVGRTVFRYDKIEALAESADYFLLIYDASHAQAYDKTSISGGTAEDFRALIEGATGKKIVQV